MSACSESFINKAKRKVGRRIFKYRPHKTPLGNFSGYVFHIRKYGIIYYAIPKVANTTLKWMMFDLIRPDLPAWVIERVDDSNELQPMVRDRSVYNYLKREGYILEKSQAATTECKVSFCVVRHPIDRVISCWRDKIREPDISNTSFQNGVHRGFLKFGDIFRGGMGLNEFATAVAAIPNEKANPHFRDQVDFVQMPEQHLVVSNVCKFEKFEDGMRIVFQRAGIAQSAMKQKNTQKRDTSERLAEETLDILERRFRRDFTAFGYEAKTSKASFNGV